MYKDLKGSYWWSGMKREIVEYVSTCLTCERLKAEHQVPLEAQNLGKTHNVVYETFTTFIEI
ncbi:Protein FAR1-RELATED SEQUENCE 5 [Gossypium australe]|uniref:Protein FAR1-RELATED SEQUENCE 5 n=1 Tax=Gossypium australe TaxID=47621 RepID=A0A5B6X5G5_9ROSI|nr:Protein FAR1-RELATED SEQUENCE 5 [Gossypium australe]